MAILRNPRLWIGLFSGALVLSVAVVDMGRTSPGPLATVHARESKLTGFNSCAQCHGGWFGEMTESCLACHGDIGGQIDSGRGLHGMLGKKRAAQCAICHSDHHGEEFTIVNRQSFAQAGISDPTRFDHNLIGFTMTGRHTEIACYECHKNADLTVLPDGGKRYLGLVQDCATCHEDPHKGQMQQSCAQCHSQTAFDVLHSEGHDDHLPLEGGHLGLSCRQCHAEDKPHSLEALGHGNAPAARDCQDCHDSPHRTTFVERVAAAANMAPRASCVACHVTEHGSFRENGLVVTPEHHALSGFPLDAPHDQPDCTACHPPAVEEFDRRYPGRGPEQCATCHNDPHGGQFGKSAACIECHDPLRFEPHAYTVKNHERTGLALTGRHVETDCNSCHRKPVEDAPRVFRGTPTNCDLCHKDAHDGFFEGTAAEKARHGQCAKCHLTTSFSTVPAKRFKHARWTGFAVLGAHAQGDCESCHPRSDKPDAAGRTFGRVAAHFGSYEGCATCHKDPHRGAFDTKKHPKRVGGQAGCARCHVQSSFRTFPDGFDHGRWTGFPIVGAHARTNCSDCHKPLRRPDRNGRTWARAKGRNCTDCHTDPHGGQFRERDGHTNCQSCHRNAMSFSDLTFRHNLDSRFRLDRTHAQVACAGCHKSVRENDLRFVRYKPLGTECADCHTSQKDPLRRPGRKR